MISLYSHHAGHINLIPNGKNKYIVKQNLNLTERVLKAAEAAFFALIYLLTLTYWGSLKNLSLRAWRLCLTSNCEAIIDKSLLKTGKILSGKLTNENEVIQLLLQAVMQSKLANLLDNPKKKGVIEALLTGAIKFKNLDPELKLDRDVVLAALKKDGNNLQYAQEFFKKDKEIVLHAIKQNGLALEYADKKLRRNREVILAAIRQNGQAIFLADHWVPDYILLHQNLYGKSTYINKKIIEDREIALEFLINDKDDPSYAAWICAYYSTFLKDRNFVFEVAKHNAFVLEFVDDRIKKDRNFFLELLNLTPPIKGLLIYCNLLIKVYMQIQNCG